VDDQDPLVRCVDLFGRVRGAFEGCGGHLLLVFIICSASSVSRPDYRFRRAWVVVVSVQVHNETAQQRASLLVSQEDRALLQSSRR
jgi:hypothetical protein